MTSIPIVTRAQVAAQFRDAGGYLATAIRLVLFAIGWLLAKACRLIATAVGALLFGAGWLGGRVAWPALRWAGAAVRIGWQQGAKPAATVRT